jgi:BirA family biotin operon repressor/biotin-[acetyl-CoA-carboxylase] ligase
MLLDRRKVAGILVGGELLADGRLAVVIGFGVNCVSHPDTDGPIPADDLLSRGLPVDAEALFAALARCLATELVHWDAGDGFAAVRSAWLARAAGVGEPIRVNLEGRTVDGRFEDLDDEGRLVLVRTGGVRERFSAGDVFFAAAG